MLSLQLPFAIIPLIHAVANKQRMGEFRIGPWLQALAWLVAGVIVALNIKLILDQITAWLQQVGDKAWILQITVIPIMGLLAVLLLYITILPWLPQRIGQFGWPRLAGVHRQTTEPSTASLPQPSPYQRVAVALDFSGKDEKLLAESLRVIDKAQTQLMLLHVVESPVARTLGAEGEDMETLSDREHLEKLVDMMKKAGISTEWRLASGDPVSGLAKMINELKADMVIVGSHGHMGVSDLVHGTVISNLRHQIKASVMIVPLGT